MQKVIETTDEFEGMPKPSNGNIMPISSQNCRLSVSKKRSETEWANIKPIHRESPGMPWIAKKVFVDSSDDFESVLLDDVDPLFSTIKEMDGVESFHYFRYNNQEGAFMRVRALAEENAVSAVEQEFQNHLNHAAIESIEPEEFDGNEEQWGEATWEILYKHFEYMTETALRILNAREAGELGTPEEVDYDTPVLSGEKAETDPLLERHMHLLANQLGYGLQEEAQFHQIQAMAKGLSPDQC